MKSYPEPPGPPGLTSNEPRAAPVAVLRMSARSIDLVAGFFQSIGAFAVAHWNSPPSQDFHFSTWL
jgi:hypothetical protein